MVKRFLIHFLFLLIISTLSSCKIIDAIITDINNEPHKKQSEIAEEVLAYIEKGDVEAIREMFCERIQKRTDLDDKIQEAIDLLDGEIISYTARGSEGSATWTRDGKKRISEFGSCREILTDNDKIYEFVIGFYRENDFESDLLGIFDFFFSEINKNATEDARGSERFLTEIIIEL